MSAIPDFLLEKATRRGIGRDEAIELWTSHTRWCDANGKDYGGLLWETLIGKVIDRIKTESRLEDAEVETAKRLAAELRAKELEDAEYAKTAVSLRDWVASLRARHIDGELLEPHEAVLAQGDLPQGHEDGAAWLMDSLRDVRTFDGRMPRRPNPCGHPGCGLPVREWTGFAGRRYFSGRCVDHTPKEDWSIR